MSALEDIQSRANEGGGYFGPMAAMRSQRDVKPLLKALRAVGAVHVPEECCCGDAECKEPNRGCAGCYSYYPCPTIIAIREALG